MTEPTLIQSVQRAFRLVEAIAGRTDRATAKELARTTGLTLSTTYHLLRTLTYEGYVHRCDDGTYTLGHALTAIADQPNLARMLAGVRPAMADIRDALHAPVYLAHYADGEISVVEISESNRATGIELWVGLHESAHATALGKSILAVLDNEARDDYLARHPLHQLTRRTVTDRAAFDAQVTAKVPVARDDGEYLLGVTCLAVPIVTSNHVAAVGVALRSPRRKASEEFAVRTLRTGADRIARALQMPLSA